MNKPVSDKTLANKAARYRERAREERIAKEEAAAAAAQQEASFTARRARQAEYDKQRRKALGLEPIIPITLSDNKGTNTDEPPRLQLSQIEENSVRKALASSVVQNAMGAEEWNLTEDEETILWTVIRRCERQLNKEPENG